MNVFSEIAAWASYAIFMIGPLLQAWRIFRRKQSEDVSLWLFVLNVFAQVILFPRIYQTGAPVLFIGHLGATIANTLALIAVIYYRKPHSSDRLA